MHRIDGAGHVDHLFVAEDPATLRPPTEITPEIMNAFQEELATFIEWAGVVLAKGDNTQLKQALVAKFAGLDVAATKAGVQGQTYTAFTTGGGAGAFTLTPNPAIGAYAAGQRFRVKFHAAGNGADTVAVSGLAAKNIKQYDSAGAKVAAVIAANQLVDVEYDGVDMVLLDPLPPTISIGLPRRYLSGLQTAINAGSPTTKIDIGAGKCRSDDDSVDIVIAATLTKQLNAAWAAGNNGGLGAGAVAANTGYHVFAIYNPTTTVSDVLFSTSYAAPAMPGGFTKKRWIGWIRTDGSSLIKPYFQRGDIFMWKTPGLDVNGSALSAGAGANYALPVPSGLVVQAMVNVQCSGPDAGCYVHSPETDAMYPATTPTTTPPLSMLSWTSSNPEMSAGSLIIPTDTSASIRVDSTSIFTETIYIGTLGWISARGRND